MDNSKKLSYYSCTQYSICLRPISSSTAITPHLLQSGIISEENVFILGGAKERMPKFSDEELLELHRQGLPDRWIAERFGVTQAAVNYRRQRLGLKNNYKPNTFSDDELLALHNQGWNDREISETLGVTQAAINYRRKRRELPSNYIREKPFFDLYNQGLSAEEMAQKLDAPLPAVLHMMKKYEITPEKAAAEIEI